ncbi:hypothetical protein D9H25_02535, partial [Escherichia coli]|nr:hypothetical protein [Escherichia coli]
VISIIYICKSGQKVIDDRRYTALFKIKLFLIIIIILNFLTLNILKSFFKLSNLTPIIINKTNKFTDIH